MPPHSIAAIVLAAGRSSRMGRPKPFLEWRGRTFVETVVGRAREIGASPIVVVANPEHRALYAELALGDCVLVENPQPDRGMFSSLQIGIAALPLEAAHAVFCPVDCPAISPAAWERVAQACALEPGALVRAVHGGRPGHPASIGRPFFRWARDFDGEGGARAFMELFQAAILDVDVDDPNVLRDVDTPDDYDRLA